MQTVAQNCIKLMAQQSIAASGSQRATQDLDLGGPNFIPSHPIQAGDKKEATSISLSTVGAPKAGQRPHPNSDSAPNTSALLPTPISTPHWRLGKAKTQRSKSKLTNLLRNAYEKRRKTKHPFVPPQKRPTNKYHIFRAIRCSGP